MWPGTEMALRKTAVLQSSAGVTVTGMVFNGCRWVDDGSFLKFNCG